jgi:nucleoid-associated protein YgaU
MRAQYNSDFEFFHTLSGYFKFSAFVLLLLVLLIVLVWNTQPWFEIEIKSASKANAVTTETTAPKKAERALQSNIEILNYKVRPGETLSTIAARFEVPVRTLQNHNHLDNPNALRSGQHLKIPRRSSQ